ncbi:MAG: hypothetical protein U1F43_20595 [Myxococcota bacterium]
MTKELLEFASRDPRFAVLEVGTTAASGAMVRIFEQYRWDGSGPKPRPGSGGAPGEPGFVRSEWVLSKAPKTTFDDASVSLREAEGTIANWEAAGRQPPPVNKRIDVESPGGIQFVIYLDDKLIRVTSAFVEASCF